MWARNWRALALAVVLALFLLLPYRGPDPHGAADVLVAYTHTVEARQALQEGQFPIRTAPWQWEATQYPVFQFYSPLVYSILGGADLLLHDPWTTLRIVLFAVLALAAIGAYRLGKAVGGSEEIGLLCAAAYMLLPYYAINIQARGAIAEVFGQALLPWCGLALWRVLKAPTFRTCAVFAIGCAALIHTHLVTAAYFLLFCAFGLTVYAALSRSWAWLPWFAAGCMGAIAASAWILWPIATTSSMLVASQQTTDPGTWSFLSRWWSLLSPVSVSPTRDPVPGSAGLHPSLGAPGLIACALLARRAWRDRSAASRALLATILVVAFAVWSPFNFWRPLPSVLKLAQFPYRLLAQFGWLVILALAWGLRPWVPKLQGKWHLIGALIIAGMLLDFTYLVRRMAPVSRDYINQVDRSPSFGYAKDMYLVRSMDFTAAYLDGARLPAQGSDGYLRTHEFITFDAAAMPPDVVWRLDIEADRVDDKPVIYVWSGPRVVATYPITSGRANIDIPLGRIVTSSGGLVSLAFSVNRASKPNGLKPLSSHIVNPSQPGLLITDTRPNCETARAQIICRSGATESQRWQLPILYYPSLLELELDGRPIDYRSSPWSMQGLLTPLASIDVPSGNHTIRARFRGSPAADWITVGALIVLALALGHSDRPGPRKSP